MSEPTTPNERDTSELVSDERVMWQWNRIDSCLHGRLSVIWFARAVIDDYRAAVAAQRTDPAAARIAELEADRDSWAKQASDRLDDAVRFAAERDALREDAERYRLLRRGQRWSVVDGVGDLLRAEKLDAAIDAIRSAYQGKEGGGG